MIRMTFIHLNGQIKMFFVFGMMKAMSQTLKELVYFLPIKRGKKRKKGLIMREIVKFQQKVNYFTTHS